MEPTEIKVTISGQTGVEMPVWCYGERGSPLIYIPSSEGDEREFSRYGMTAVAEPWIRSGRVRIFSIDGHGPRSLFDDELQPEDRIFRYAAFERYAVEELLPLIKGEGRVDRVDVVGVSYGAFAAANLLFKHSDSIRFACGLGGVYGLWHRLHGYHDDDVYFHTPLEYLPRLVDPAILDAIRATDGLTLYGGESDSWLHSTERMIRVLREKALPYEAHVWASPVDHHERWWREQFRDLLTRKYGEP